jgi:hypothetical protein
MLSILNHLDPIDKHMPHARGILVRPGKSSVVLNRRRVKDHDIGKIPFLEPAAPVQLQRLGRQRRQPANRFL